MAYKFNTEYLKAPDLMPGLEMLERGVARRRQNQLEAERMRREDAAIQREQDQKAIINVREQNRLDIERDREERAREKDAFDQRMVGVEQSDKLAEMVTQPGGVQRAKARATALGGKLEERSPEDKRAAAEGLLSTFGMDKPEENVQSADKATGNARDVQKGLGMSMLGGVSLPPEVDAYIAGTEKQAKAAKQADKLVFTMGGNEIELDPQAETSDKRERRAAVADDFLRNVMPTMRTDAERAFAEVTAELLRSSDQDGAIIQGFETKMQQLGNQSFQKGENALDRAAADRRARIAASARAEKDKALADPNKSEARLPFMKEARAELDQLLKVQDFAAARDDYMRAQNMLEDLSSGNDAQVRRALGIWAKESSGPGSVQESERQEFVRNVGGKIQGIQQKFMEWVQSDEAPAIPESQLQIFRDALEKTLVKRADQRLGNISGVVRDTFATHPIPELQDQSYSDWAVRQVLGPRKRKPGQSTSSAPPPAEEDGGEIDTLIKKALSGN